MAILKIKEIGRNWWNRSARRDIYINGKHSGILATNEIELEVAPGPCKVTVQNTFPTFRSSAYINIEDGAENNVEFRDSRWFLNFIMVIDVAFLFIRNLLPVPKIFRSIGYGYGLLWFLYSLIKKDGHYKIFAYSRVPLNQVGPETFFS